MQMNNNEDQLKEIIKNDVMVSGIKLWDEAIKHLDFLLKNHHHPESGTLNAIRFYVMGYAAGVQSKS